MEQGGRQKRQRNRWDEAPTTWEEAPPEAWMIEHRELSRRFNEMPDWIRNGDAIEVWRRMWDEDAVPEFLEDIGVETLDPEMRALNCRRIALEKEVCGRRYELTDVEHSKQAEVDDVKREMLNLAKGC